MDLNLFKEKLLNNHSAHGESATIKVTDLNPVQSFAISSHINIHPVVWPSDCVHFSEHPVAFGIIDS